MRILHILNHTERLNGHVHACVDIACAQAAMGHEVAVASGYGTFDALLARHGVETLRIDQRRSPAVLLTATTSLFGLLHRRRFDVVHAHMVTSAILVWPACLAFRIPLVTTVHNEFQRSAVLMGIGTRVIAVSHAVRASMQKRGVSASRLRVVLNGTIGSARFDAACAAPADLGTPSILFVGGLHPRKGVLDLLRAFDIIYRSNPAARLAIVGEGPYLDAYAAVAFGMASGGSISFLGGQDDPRPFMRGADIFVLPSLKDPAPLVIPEAREAGCAIVASDVDGIPELLEGGRAGILVPPNDPERLAAALWPLVNDPAALATWRKASQINIARMTTERVAREILAIYAECLERQHSRSSAAVTPAMLVQQGSCRSNSPPAA